MENSNNKKKIILSIICIILLILFSVGMVYAFFVYTRVGSRNNIVNMADIIFEFGESDWIWIENATPITTEQALTLETSGNDEIDTVDGGIAQFKVIGGNSAGAIHYQVLLVKEDITSSYSSQNGTYTIDPSTKIGQFPDGAVSVNLQTSTSDIFETTGLVNDESNLTKPGKSFQESSSIQSGITYINNNNSVRLSYLPQGSNYNEKILGEGIMSGRNATRYFELRMWLNNTVYVDDNLRETCLANTTSSDIDTNGFGYCPSSIIAASNFEDPNRSVNYVYSTGEFSKMYYSVKIKVQTTEVTNGVIDDTPSITKNIKLVSSPKRDTSVSFNTVANTQQTSGLFLMESTKDDDYPIYYYRGNVQNNHLIFGEYCWKIVRTTETGGTRIIYDGVPNNGVCNNTGDATSIDFIPYNYDYDIENEPAYFVGYKYKYDTWSSDELYEHAFIEIDGEDISSDTIVYGKDVRYDNGIYTLVDTVSKDMVNFEDDLSDYESLDRIGLHPYTCLGNTTTCSDVYYITSTMADAFYIVGLYNGSTIEDYIEEYIDNHENTVKSNALKSLEYFYTSSFIGDNNYSNLIEDSVYCNDRSTDESYDKTNFINYETYFGAFSRLANTSIPTPTLTCPNPLDRFTVSASIGNGELDYPIGLLTADEAVLAGAAYYRANDSLYLKNGTNQATMTPSSSQPFSAQIFSISTRGTLDVWGVITFASIRPVITLSKEAKVEEGTGTSDDPFVISPPL